MASVSFQAITAANFATLVSTPANLTPGRIYFVTDASSGITRIARAYHNGTVNTVEDVLSGAVATPITFDGVSLSWKDAKSTDKTLAIAGALKVDSGTGDIVLQYGSPLEYIIGAPQKDDTIAKALARLYNQFDVTGQALADHAASSSAHSVASTTYAGFMSSADKSKLNGIATGANNYSHPTTDGNLHVPATGTTNNGKFLMAGATAGVISWQSLTKTTVGLANVDNTSDADKPISSATQTALNSKAPLASPTFTGTPAAPTPAASTNTTQIATTAFVQTVVGNAIASVFKYMGSATAATIAANNTAIAGHAYRVSAAGNIASAEGDTYAEVGDLAICTASNPRTWTIIQNNIDLDGLITEVLDDLIDVELDNGKYTIGHHNPNSLFTAPTAATGVNLSFGGSFTALIDTGFSAVKGHITGLQKKTFTLPSQTNLSGLSENTDGSKVMTSLTHSGHALTAVYNTIISRLLTGYSKGAAATVIAATDTLGAALGKLENRLDVVETLLTWN